MAEEFTGYPIELENRTRVEAGALPFMCAGSEDEAQLPPVVDPEEWGLHVENQGPMSSCGGHGESTGAESLLYWEHGVTQQMSRLFMYLTGQQECGLFGADRGVTIEALVRSAESRGICEEILCPYPNPIVYPGGSWRPTQAMLDNAAQYRIKSYVSMKKQPNPWAASLDWIGHYGVVLMGIRWPVAIDSQGVVRQWRAGQSGHCICGVGYVRDWANPGKRLIKVANSHGATYGKKGYLYFSEQAWMDCARDPQTVMIGQTSLSSPKRNPRVWDGKRPLMQHHKGSLI